MIIHNIPMFKTYTMLSESNFSDGFLANLVSLDGQNYGQTVFSREIKASADNGIGMPVETDRGYVHYIFQASRDSGYKVMSTGASNTEPSPGLRINGSYGPIGSMDEHTITSALNSAGMRQGHRHKSINFDFRSLLYICGFYVGRASASVSIAPPNPKAPMEIDCLTRDGLHDIRDSAVLTGAMCSGKDEVMTAVCLLNMAGVKRVFTVAQQIDASGKKFCNLTLGSYCAKLAVNVISQAKEIGCGATHVLAYMRGLSHAITIRSHSEEGGIVRELLSHCSYPPSAGILNESTFKFKGILSTAPVTQTTHNLLCLHATEILLLLAAAATAADPGSEMDGIKIPRALFRVCDNPTRPSDWYNFDSAVREWASKLIDNIHSISGFANVEVKDISSYTVLLSDDAPNRHVKRQVATVKAGGSVSGVSDPLMPFFWVEGSPINPGFDFPYFMPFDHDGKSNTFATLPFDDIKVPPNYCDDTITHRAIRGTRLILRPKRGTTFRSMGAMYLYSNQLSSVNGLASIEIIKNTTEKCYQPFGMTSPEAKTLAEARWFTPHNCIPHPASGLVFDNHVLVINYSEISSLRLPSKWILEKNNITAVSRGPFFNNNTVTTSKHRIPTDKFIPRRIFRAMAGHAQYVGSESEFESLLDQFGDFYQNSQGEQQTLEPLMTVNNSVQISGLIVKGEQSDGLPGTFGSAAVEDGSNLVGVGKVIKREVMPKQSIETLFPSHEAAAKAAVDTAETEVFTAVDSDSFIDSGLVIPAITSGRATPLEPIEAAEITLEEGLSKAAGVKSDNPLPIYDPGQPLSDKNYGLTGDRDDVRSVHFVGPGGSLVHNGEKVTLASTFSPVRLKLRERETVTQNTDPPVHRVCTGSYYGDGTLYFEDPKTKVTFKSAFDNREFFSEASSVFTLIEDSKLDTDTIDVPSLKAGLGRNFNAFVQNDDPDNFSFIVGRTYIKVPAKASITEGLSGEK
jgi:hypothetical protein